MLSFLSHAKTSHVVRGGGGGGVGTWKALSLSFGILTTCTTFHCLSNKLMPLLILQVFFFGFLDCSVKCMSNWCKYPMPWNSKVLRSVCTFCSYACTDWHTNLFTNMFGYESYVDRNLHFSNSKCNNPFKDSKTKLVACFNILYECLIGFTHKNCPFESQLSLVGWKENLYSL
jgi:hypothetical protein